VTQNNRNQNKHNALEARIAVLEAELAACQKTQQAQRQGDGAPLPTPLSAPLTTKAREPDTMPELGMVSSLIQHTLLPTAVFDADVRYVAASEGWLEAYGLQDRDIIGVSHYDLFPEIDADWKAIHARCLTGVHETRSEDSFPRADGGMDWITWSVYPWYDGEGEIAGLVMSTAVVTEQVLARENERIFRELVESASDGIVMSDLDDTIRYANPAYKTMLGVDADVDLTGQSLKAYASSDLDDLNSTMRREGRWRGVIEQRRTSGDVFPADVTAFAMRDETGSLTRRAAMYRDMTNEQRILGELASSSQQLQVIMQSLPVVLFVTDTEGIITLSEGQALPLLGLRAGEVVGRSIFAYYAAKHDVVDNVRRALAGQTTTFDMYFEEQDLYFQRHFAPLYAEDGQVTGMLGIGYDVTARKRAEITLKDTELRLRTLIANLPGVLFSVDTQGVYTLFEGKGLADIGRSPGDVVGQSLFERYPDDDELLAKVRATLAGEHIVYESHAEKVDQHFENIYTPLRQDDGSIAGMLGLAVNITDRKQAEVNVDAWKRRYDMIVASSGQVVYEYDVATGDITWSGSVKRVLGFDVADMAGGIDRWMALIHPVDADEAVAALEQAQEAASAYNIEYRFKNAKGNYIPMVDRGFFLTDDSGIAVTMLGMMQDISERKRAEKDLQLFRTLVASATDGILLTNADGTIAYNNDAYGQLLGLDQADFDNDLLGELAEVSLSDNGKATLVEAVGDILTTGRWEGFIEHQHKQGYAIPTLMTSFAINDEETGELQYVANIIKDITAQQDAQDRLVASERRLQILVANLPVILFATDKDGIATLSEGKALRDIGLQAGQNVGVSVFDHYRDMPVVTEHAKRALAGEASTFEVYYPKTDHYFERYFAPMFDDSGQVTGMLGIGYNITERKRASQALEAERKRVVGLYQAVPDTIIRIHKDGTFLDYKPSSYFASYIDPATTIGQNMRDNVAPEVVEQAFASLEAAIDTGEMQKFENVLEVDGDTRYRENRFVKLNDEEAIAIVRDVTDLRRAEREMRASQQRLQAVLANLPVIVFTVDTKGLFTMSEGKGLAAIGLQPGQVVGMSAWELYADFEAVLQGIQRALTGETLTLEIAVAGQVLDSYFTPLYDETETVSGVLGVAYNVTERNQAENALRESQRLLEDAQRIGRIGAWSFDLVSQELTWSKQVYEQFGGDPNTPLTLDFAVSFYVDLEPLQAAMGRAIEQAEPYELELEITTTSGERRWVVSIGNPVIKNDQVVRLTGIQQDITERKQAENALRESQQQLERAQRVANFGNFAISVVDMGITASAHALDMHELPQDAPLSLSDLVPLMSEADFAKVRATIEQSVANAREASVAYTLQLPSGIHRDIHAIWQTLQNDRGEVYQIFGTVQDITRQKRAETALLENQRLLEDAQRIGQMGSWSLEVATGEVTWSKQTYALLEIDESQPLSLELVMSSYVDPDALQSAFERAIQHAEPYDIEAEVITGGGKHRWVRVMCNPVVQDEQVVRLTGIIQDISDIKKAEAELQNANSHLARINHIGSRLQGETSLEGMLEAVLEPLDAPENAMIFYAQNDSDDASTMTAIELATCYHETMIPLGTTFQLADYPWTQMYLDNPHETFIVTNVYQDPRINELAHPVFAEFNFTTLIIVPLVQGNTWTGIFQMGWAKERQLTAGELAYFKALPTLLAPSITNRRLLDSLEQTINERTRALQDQLTETVRFKSIVEATADLVSYGDLDGNVLYLNPAGRQILGYDEQGGRYLPNVSDVYDDAGNERFALEVMPAVLETGLWRGEAEVIGADGQMIPVSQVVNSIPDEEGHIVGIGTLVRDITESKALEENLRQSNAVLNRLSELSQAVNRATNKQELLELISELAFAEGAAGIVLHDVDNQTMTNQRPEAMIVSASLTAAGSSDPAFPTGSSIRLADFQATRLFIQDTNNNLYISDAQNDPRYDDASKQLFAAIGSHAQVTVPLLQGNRWIGMIGIYWHEVHDYREDEKQLYDALRTLVPPVLANLNIVADLENLVEARSSELRASNERLALISQASTKLNESESLDDMINAILGVMVTRQDIAVTVSYPLHDDAGEVIGVEVRAVQQRGASQLPITPGIASYISDHPIIKDYLSQPEQATFIDDVMADERFDAQTRAFLQSVGVASQAIVALRQGDDIIGTVGINAAIGQPFSEQERQFIRALPSLLAPTVANLRLLESLEQTISKRTAELQNQLTETTRFKTLIETTTDMVGYADLDGNIQYVNPAGYALFASGQASATDMQARYQHVSQMYTEASNRRFAAEVAPAIAAHGSWRGEMVLQRMDGSHVPVSQVIAVIPDHQGQPVALGTVVRDITDSKALEHNLKTSNAQLTRLSELSQAFNRVTSKQALLEIAAMLAFDEGSSAATLFDLDGQEHTGGTPETMTIAARSRADGKVDDIPVGMTFTLAEFASATLWLDYPDQLLCVENIFEDDRIDDETRRVLVETANTQAYVVVPLLQNNRWVGTFNFTWNEPHVFLDRELQLYEALMTLVPPVLANLNIVADLEDLVAARSSELRASNEQLALINRISNELKAASSSDMMLEVLLEPLDRTASASLFYAVTDDQGEMTAIKLVARRSPVTEPPLGTVLQLADFPSTQLWFDAPDSPLLLSDIMQDDRIDEVSKGFYAQLGIASAVTVPLRQSREWIGLLFITYPEVTAFAKHEETYFNALPAMLAPPLANRRMVENLEDTVAQRSEELSRSRQLLRSTIDNAPLIIFVKDTDLRYILANRNIHRVIPGATPRDVIGRKDGDLLPAEIAQDVHAKDRDILANKQVLNYESERNFDGTTQTFLVTKFPMLDENGELFALGTIATDISERKVADAKMRDYRDQLAKAETELQITQRIQELLLPASHELQAIEDLDIASYMQPAEQVGGDYYDVLHIGDRVKIGIGDVTGHGLESGLLMLMTQTAVRTLLSSDEHDSKRVMDILNRTVFANLQRMQVDKSLTLSLLDYNQGKLSLSGQHEHVLIMRAGGSVETIDTIDLGMPLGLEEDITRFIAEHVVHLQPGEGVVLFTDGITEAENDARDQFGLPRLIDLVGKHWEKPAEAIVLEIINAVYDHIAAHEVYDDITLIVFKRPLVTDAPSSQKALAK
jgi:PAS domain S-box-containing protein